MERYLKIGDMSVDGRVEIIDEDRLCYQVRNISKSAIGIRTISKNCLMNLFRFLPQIKMLRQMKQETYCPDKVT